MIVKPKATRVQRQVLISALLLALILAGCDNGATSRPATLTSPPTATHTPWYAATLTISPPYTPHPTSTPTAGPTPAATPDCPNVPDPTVSIRVDPVALAVGDTLTVTYTSLPKYAGLAEASLLVDATKVAVVAQSHSELVDPGTIQMLPGTEGYYNGDGKFVIQALRPGTFDVQVRVFGDAEFCTYLDGRCSCGTTFKWTVSDPVSITISSPDDKK
jgi:hypothetical protein